jgi:sugar diacid utilization regulator/putative methionine-R-sulfoxide reductase with GAF domain
VSLASRILSAVDLEAALSSVTHEALIALEADIAGVFLREGEQIVMRGCVGNRSRETGRLRMARNEGLAGLVFATGEAARVDTYVRSETISAHFHDLARAEDVQSALGAPLILGGEVIGVLEVWRRRESVFTSDETDRLIALAELGAIALNNARLHDATVESMQQVELAHRQLAAQLAKVEHALRNQQDLVGSILDGGGLPGTLRVAATGADASAVYLDPDLEPVAVYPPTTDGVAVAAALREVVGRRTPSAPVWTHVAERSLVARAVSAGSDHLGWLALVVDAPIGDETAELAVTQAGLACSLNNLEEQAAARARASAREELLLGLVSGTPEERRVAASRARHVQVDLRGELRMLHGELGGLAQIALAEGWDAGQLDDVRRKLLHVCQTSLGARWLLGAVRGDSVLLLVRSASTAATREHLVRLAGELAAAAPGLHPVWGVSAAHSGPMELVEAAEEATTAAAALRHVADRTVSCYSELGILRLMLADPRSTDLARFVSETVGPVLAYDRRHGTELLTTLRAYVDSGCSQQDTAARLFLHAKTIKYRLVQVEKLTGLDLAGHHDRLRVDIAVRAAEMLGTGTN